MVGSILAKPKRLFQYRTIQMLRRTKAKLKALLTQPETSGQSSQDALIAQVVNEQLLALPESRIKIYRSREETAENGLLPDAPFADFLGHFSRLRADGDANKESLARQKTEHPFLCDFAELAVKYLNQCDSLPEAVAPLMRRMFYRLVSILNTKESANIFDYKRSLPKVGLFFFTIPDRLDL